MFHLEATPTSSAHWWSGGGGTGRDSLVINPFHLMKHVDLILFSLILAIFSSDKIAYKWTLAQN